MSSRRSLYRANRSHTSLYGPRTDTSVSHWRLDYVTINTTRDEEPSADAPPKTNSFQVKTWVQISGDAFNPLDDGVENDALSFVKHAHLDMELSTIGSHEPSEPPADSTPKPEANGLSSLPDSSTQATTSGANTADITPSVTPAAETPVSTDSERVERVSVPAAPAEPAPATAPAAAPAHTEPVQTSAPAQGVSAAAGESAPLETDAQAANSGAAIKTVSTDEPASITSSNAADASAVVAPAADANASAANAKTEADDAAVKSELDVPMPDAQ